MITSAGIGSGLDLENLIVQLVSAEGSPAAARLDRQEAEYQAELSGLGLTTSALSQFQSSLSNLKDLANFQPRTADSSDTATFTATATNAAVAGDYQIQVLTVAEAHKVSSSGVTDANTDVGTGTLTITINGESFDVTIDDSNETLGGIRDAINGAADNTGVSATIVNVDDGGGGTESRLVLTSTNTGTDYNVNVTVVDDDGMHTDTSGLSMLTSVNLTQLNASVDASIQIDGQAVTRSSNTIDDAIDGVTLELIKADAGVDKTLSVTLDEASVLSSVNAFIFAYNSLQSTINQLTFYNPSNETSGILIGDATLRNIENQVSSTLVESVPAITSGFNTLSSIGIVTGANGTLELDTEVFNAALDSNFDDIGALFADETNGIAVQMDTLLDGYIGSEGIMDARTEGIQTSIDDIQDARERLNDRLLRIEARFRSEFSALDALIANFQSTQDFLTQQLADLPGFTRKDD